MSVQRERDVLIKEKEEEVIALHSKLHVMEKSYDAILQVCYICIIIAPSLPIIHACRMLLCGKMEAVRQKWDSESHDIEHKTQQILMEFGTPGWHIVRHMRMCKHFLRARKNTA